MVTGLNLQGTKNLHNKYNADPSNNRWNKVLREIKEEKQLLSFKNKQQITTKDGDNKVGLSSCKV